MWQAVESTLIFSVNASGLLYKTLFANSSNFRLQRNSNMSTAECSRLIIPSDFRDRKTLLLSQHYISPTLTHTTTSQTWCRDQWGSLHKLFLSQTTCLKELTKQFTLKPSLYFLVWCVLTWPRFTDNSKLFSYCQYFIASLNRRYPLQLITGAEQWVRSTQPTSTPDVVAGSMANVFWC